MNERDLLEMVAEGAPHPSPHYIDEVIRIAGRARSRRRTATLVAAPALAIATSAVIAVAPWPHHGAQALQPQPGHAAQARDPAAAPYAAAIRIAVTDDMSGDPSGTRPTVLYVLDHTCTGVEKRPPSIRCAGQPLASGLRHDLAEALRSYAPVHFVPADGPGVRDKQQTVRNGGFLVVLGPIRLDGPQADVPVAVERGLLDGRGTTVALTIRSGRWVIDDTPHPGVARGGWIS